MNGAEEERVIWDIWPLLSPRPDPLMAAAVRPLVSIEPLGAEQCALSLTAGAMLVGGGGPPTHDPSIPWCQPSSNSPLQAFPDLPCVSLHLCSPGHAI